VSDYQLDFDIAAMPNFPLAVGLMLGVFALVAAWQFYTTRPSHPQQVVRRPSPLLRFFAVKRPGQPGARLRSFALTMFLMTVPFSALFLAFWLGQYLVLLDARLEGRFRVAEGCLAAFHPSSGASRLDTDRIQVAGHTFAYPSPLWRMASFNQAESEGGPIHADSRVRLAFVGDSIIRFETIDQDCPQAADFAQ